MYLIALLCGSSMARPDLNGPPFKYDFMRLDISKSETKESNFHPWLTELVKCPSGFHPISFEHCASLPTDVQPIEV